MPSEHPSIPITPSQQAHQAAIAIAAGAGAIHVHPRDSTGRESLADIDVAATLKAIRTACPGVPIGVSTGVRIVPETDRRLALIEQWKVLPDFAGVNFHEPGAEQTCQLLFEKGVQFEAGIWNGEAAHLFRRRVWRANVSASLSSRHKSRAMPKNDCRRSKLFCKT